MGLKVGAYMTFWESKPTRNGGEMVRLSASRYNDQTRQYDTDFSSIVFIGGKAASMANLEPKTRIVVDEFEVRNTYNKQTKETNWTVTLWKWHVAEPYTGGNGRSQRQGVSEDNTNELPF